MSERKPTPEALEAARACLPELVDRFGWIPRIGIAMDDFAALPFDKKVEIAVRSACKRGYEAAIAKLRQRNKKLYGDAPEHLAAWLDADNVRPPEAR